MTQKQAQKAEFSLYLKKKLVSDFDKAIYPYKRSNVITELISDFLVKSEGKNPSVKVPKIPKSRTTSNV